MRVRRTMAVLLSFFAMLAHGGDVTSANVAVSTVTPTVIGYVVWLHDDEPELRWELSKTPVVLKDVSFTARTRPHRTEGFFKVAEGSFKELEIGGRSLRFRKKVIHNGEIHVKDIHDPFTVYLSLHEQPDDPPECRLIVPSIYRSRLGDQPATPEPLEPNNSMRTTPNGAPDG